MSRKNILSGVIVLAVFVFFFIQSGMLNEQAAYWPKFVCVIGILLSAGSLVQSFLALRREGEAAEALFPLTGAQIRNALIVLVILAVWGWGISNIGFLVTSIVCMSATFLIFMPEKDMKKRLINILIAVIVGAVFFFLFKELGVRFPKTILM